MSDLSLGDVFPTPFEPESTSFAALLRRAVPGALAAHGGGAPLPASLHAQMVEGTTVVALHFADGVIIAGDRRATSGNLISKTDMRKVFPADRHSAVAISGAAGPAMEMARVFATELEHYEKVENAVLSLDGKSNKLAGMVRANMGMAMQGIVVVPLFAGVDPHTGAGGIYEYDPIGGRYTARRYAGTGSGALIAIQTLKAQQRADADADTAARVAITSLFDAAEQDSATGGPDLIRRIYPIVAVITAEGYSELSEDDVRTHVDAIVAERETRG